MLDLRPTRLLRLRLLRTAGTLAVLRKGHRPCPSDQDCGQLRRGHLLEFYPLVLRDRPHHPPVAHPHLIRQVIPREPLRDRFGAMRRAALTVLITLYDNNATQKANSAALG